MALKITKASDPIRVEQLNTCIYGPPGLGKTSLAFTSEAPLLLDFDHGAYRAANRRDSVTVGSWDDVTSISDADLKDYKTVVIDTAGRALDVLTASIIKKDPKLGRGGSLTLQGYGALKGQFVAWLRHLNSFGLDVILIAHMDEQRNGDEIIERLDVQGGSKGEIYKAADAMGRIVLRDGQRVLTFDPTDAAFGKNPGRLNAMPIPHPSKDPAFLAEIIQSIKDSLNSMSEEQIAEQKLLETWRASIASMQTADDFNSELENVRKAPKPAQVIFAAAATDAGLVFDRKAKAYQPKSEQREPAQVE